MTKKTISPTRTSPSPIRQHVRDNTQQDAIPVDDAVERKPAVARLRSHVLRLTERVQARHPDARAFIRYADERARLEALRTDAYFDEGYARGEVAGAAAGRQASAAGRALVRQVTEAALAAPLPRPTVIATLLEAARGLVLAAPPRRRRAGAR